MASHWQLLDNGFTMKGFKYIHHKKGLYFDRHDVHYVVGDVDQELIIPDENYVEHRLVLLTQDVITVQANNITSKMWVLEDQHHLQKKSWPWPSPE
jgi:hypothetical protein